MIFWFLTALRKYAVFDGRSRRREYWYFVLVTALVTLALTLPYDLQTGGNPQLSPPGPIALFLSFVYGLFVLAMFVPSLALSVRRLHDTGRSGWWVLVGLVPFFGGLVLLYFSALDSEPGDNRFGPNPKGLAANLAAPVVDRPA
jgi:uncharacterized membrane protein YhaH (DUF805 family)